VRANIEGRYRLVLTYEEMTGHIIMLIVEVFRCVKILGSPAEFSDGSRVVT
jgi:hypothetical protein